jgi:hypothetical protein
LGRLSLDRLDLHRRRGAKTSRRVIGPLTTASARSLPKLLVDALNARGLLTSTASFHLGRWPSIPFVTAELGAGGDLIMLYLYPALRRSAAPLGRTNTLTQRKALGASSGKRCRARRRFEEGAGRRGAGARRDPAGAGARNRQCTLGEAVNSRFRRE